MCNQSVGLIASVIERSGIPTVAVSLLREVTEKVMPPRALLVPFDFGFPLGEPLNAELQISVIRKALSLLENAAALPAIESYA